MRTASDVIALVLALALTLGVVPAHAETTVCSVISTVPHTITAPGIYCLTGDLTTNLASGEAITIAANNVVLDLNGHKLGNLAAGTGTRAVGIRAVDRKNLTIKNGTVRGFFDGISLGGTASQGHVVEDIRADQNTFKGIGVSGRGNVVRNNRVVATGGATGCTPDCNAFGIIVGGPENRVLNNNVIDTFATGSGSSLGIDFAFATGAADGMAVNNRITHADFGIFYGSDTTGKFRDNLTSGVSTPFSHPAGVIDAGGNN